VRAGRLNGIERSAAQTLACLEITYFDTRRRVDLLQLGRAANVLTATEARRTLATMASEVAAVIACIIEFGVKDGRDDDRKRLLTELFVELNNVPGFLSKETFDDVDRPGRRITISYWVDANALRGWMRNAAHVRAIDLGKREIFSHYNIKIASIERETDWTAPAPLSAG
jgi:heme-degrading monooxygenase HmoA